MKYIRKKFVIILTVLFAVVSVAGIMINRKTVGAAQSRVIEDGIYTMRMSADRRFAVSVDGASCDNGANVRLDNYSGDNSQSFYFEYDGSGYYTVYCVASGKVLDVYANGTVNGTNVQQYESNKTAAQKWKVIKNSDGSYSLAAKNCGRYMDVQSGSMSKYANVWIYDGNGTSAQKFALDQVTQLPDGTYTIASGLDSNKVVDIYAGSLASSANVQLYRNNGSNAQKFNVKRNSDGTYTITNEGSGKVLDVFAGSTADRANVQQYESNGSAAQKWRIEYNNGYFNIISAVSGKYLDVADARTEDGTNIQIYMANNNTAQKFSFIPTSYNYPLGEGFYTLTCANNTNMVVDIYAGSEEKGANAQIYKYNNTNAQKFSFKQTGNGYYQIINACSGKALDVVGAGTTPGTNVDQYDINGTDAQLWKLYAVGNGTYFIQSKCNGLVLDVDNGYMVNGNNVKTYTWTGNTAQNFSVVRTPLANKGWGASGCKKYLYDNNGNLRSRLGIDVSYHQGKIDWQAVKDDGIQFTIIRVGYGDNDTSQDDKTAAYNISECERLGIPYGVYLYSYATSDDQARSEADHVVRLLQGRNPSLGVYIDIEDTTTYSMAGINIYSPDGRSRITGWAKIVMDRVSSCGYQAGVYANLDYFNNVLYADQLSGYRWLACYRSMGASCPDGNWKIWQYASDGSISGIKGNVDMNVWID